jgi:predicted Zn-dependent peptidase
VLVEHLPEAVDVLADITCRSRFDAREIEREKSVVKEEILSYEDNPEEKVADNLSAMLWGDHSLGKPILGTAESVDALDRAALREHFEQRYRGDQLVIAAAGGLTEDVLRPLVKSGFATPAGPAPEPGAVPVPHPPSVRHEVRDLQQLYLSLGTRSVSYSDPRRYALVVLETLLGGGMSSRLFQSIREEAGLAYSVCSSLDFLRDGGVLSIHLGVSPERARQALGLLRAELSRIAAEGPTQEEVDSTLQQLKGSILIAQESTSGRMHHMARQELYTGRYTGPLEQVELIMAVKRDEVAAVAAEFLAPGRFSFAALGPAPGESLGEADWPVDGIAR